MARPRRTTHAPTDLATITPTALDRAESTAGVLPIPVEAIDTSKRARRFYNAIGDLAASLDQHGLLQPVVVRRIAPDQFQLVAGGRRLEAARLLQWESVPARVIDTDESEGRVLELVENLQREDLTPEEEAEALEELITERQWSVRQLAEAVKRSPSYVSKRLRVFDDPSLREAVLQGGVSVSTAEELLSAPEAARPMLAEAAAAGTWTPTAARTAVQHLRAPAVVEDVAGDEDAESGADWVEHPSGFRIETAAPRETTRPNGLTRQIKDLRNTLRVVKPWDLTEADRRELRALFQDLVLVAQAPTERRKPVIPALPA